MSVMALWPDGQWGWLFIWKWAREGKTGLNLLMARAEPPHYHWAEKNFSAESCLTDHWNGLRCTARMNRFSRLPAERHLLIHKLLLSGVGPIPFSELQFTSFRQEVDKFQNLKFAFAFENPKSSYINCATHWALSWHFHTCTAGSGCTHLPPLFSKRPSSVSIF